MRITAVLFALVLLISCDFSEEKVTPAKAKEKIVYDLYVPSEMSLLMNVMYEENERIKKEIISGKSPDVFPEEFLKIHTAELSESKYRNETFEAYSKVLIDNEKGIFEEAGQLPLKQRYNNTINTCISCHSTECVGPIPRIKKLLID